MEDTISQKILFLAYNLIYILGSLLKAMHTECDSLHTNNYCLDFIISKL